VSGAKTVVDDGVAGIEQAGDGAQKLQKKAENFVKNPFGGRRRRALLSAEARTCECAEKSVWDRAVAEARQKRDDIAKAAKDIADDTTTTIEDAGDGAADVATDAASSAGDIADDTSTTISHAGGVAAKTAKKGRDATAAAAGAAWNRLSSEARGVLEKVCGKGTFSPPSMGGDLASIVALIQKAVAVAGCGSVDWQKARCAAANRCGRRLAFGRPADAGAGRERRLT
jgi:hypothetical protein